MFSYAVSLSCVPLVIIIVLFVWWWSLVLVALWLRHSEDFHSAFCTRLLLCVYVCVHNLRHQFVFVRILKEIEDSTRFCLSIDGSNSIVENKQVQGLHWDVTSKRRMFSRRSQGERLEELCFPLWIEYNSQYSLDLVCFTSSPFSLQKILELTVPRG